MSRIATLRTTVDKLRSNQTLVASKLTLAIHQLRSLLVQRWGKTPTTMRRDDVRALWRAIRGRGKVPAIYRGVYQAVVAALGRKHAQLAHNVASRAVKLLRLRIAKLRTRADLERLVSGLDALQTRILADITRTVTTETMRQVNADIWARKPPHTRLVWDATLDYRVCTDCASRHGKVVPDASALPPLHPHCRCVVVEAPILHPTTAGEVWARGKRRQPMPGKTVWRPRPM